MTESAETAATWGDLGRRLAEARAAADLSQHDLARQAHYSRSTIANVEVGRQRVTRAFWATCDELLGTGSTFGDAANRIADTQRATNRPCLRPQSDAGADDQDEASLESGFAIAQRLQWAVGAGVDPASLDLIEASVREVIGEHERLGPKPLAAGVVRQRQWVHDLMQQHRAPRLLERLFVAASQLSGLLAVIALEVGRPTTARTYAAEAFRLAEETRDPTPRAWVRANQSLIEYYAGDYHQAGELARDGLRLDPGGPQSIRLLVNGVGRALARLGHETEARRAIDHAQELLAVQPVPAAVSHGLSLDPYCAARVSGNATTSFHLLQRTDEALTHGRAALTVFDSEQLRGPQILTRFDLAMVLLNSHQPDPEQAAHLVSEAASIAVCGQFESVTQRASEFLASAGRWHRAAAIADVTDRIRTLTAGGGVHD